MSWTIVAPNPHLVQREDPVIADVAVSSELQIDLGEKAVDAIRRRIDQDIKNMEEAIRALKSRRNGLAPVSRLPPEILSMIFIYCVAAPKPPSTRNLDHTMEWVKVSYVSRHWRAVAVGCPYLWTNLVFTRPRWAEEMLKRSKMASLVIDARLGYKGSKSIEVLHLAMKHISRVRELKIVSASKLLGKLFHSVPRSAPLLQSLLLTGSRSHFMNLLRENYTIPPGLFSDNISQLQRLELVYCNLDWASPLLKGLTHLKIHNAAPGTRPSMILFLEVLEQLPALKSLDLKDTLPEVADGSSIMSSQRTVELPSLTYLHTSGSVSECSNALRHLSMPSSAVLKLSCRSTAPSHNDFSSILTYIGGLWEPATTIPSVAKQYKHPIRSLQFQGVTGSGGLGLRIWPTVLSFSDMSGYPDRETPPSISLFYQWFYAGHENVDRIVTDTCAALPLEQLVLLDASNMYRMEQQTWLNGFGNLAQLRSIRVQGESVHTLVSAMTADPGVATGTSMSANSPTQRSLCDRGATLPAVYFPSLLSLTLEDASFDEKRNGLYTELNALKDCLVERFERKAEVRELTLNQCRRLSKETVEELREIVVDVTWDGLETGFTDYSSEGEDDYDDSDSDD